MPSVIYEATLTGHGDSILGGSRVLFVAWEVTADGARVRSGTETDPDALIGVGYYALGNDLTPGGLISGVAWGPARWLNWRIGQNVVTPGAVGADFPSDIAQYIHWAISNGTTVHLYVFGDM